jgi:hypothetical protein
MEVEFLTQPDILVGELIDNSIAQLGMPLEFVMVSAFASLPTVLRFRPKIAQIKAAGGDVRIVLGVDLGGTSKEVLSEVVSWDVSAIVLKNRKFGVTFHPKIFFLRWAKYAEIIVGSNNFTDGGLYKNYEASSRTKYMLPKDSAFLNKARFELKRFLQPTGPVALLLTPSSLPALIALPEIPSEKTARRTRAEGIPRRPPSDVFGYEAMPVAPPIPKGIIVPLPAPTTAPAPKLQKPVSKVPVTERSDSFAIQIKPHHNGEIFLSVTAALQNPSFFNWPFNGETVPKKPGNPSYPQINPDPVVDITVFGADVKPRMTLSAYPLNTVYYKTKSEIRITASPLINVVPDYSIMIMRRSEATDRDYDIVIHRPDSPDFQRWLDACDQRMPGGGKEPRRFGWF